MNGWRAVSDCRQLTTDRLPVPGGWLYRTAFYGQNQFTEFDPRSVATTFVPDAGREWEAAYAVTKQENR